MFLNLKKEEQRSIFKGNEKGKTIDIYQISMNPTLLLYMLFYL